MIELLKRAGVLAGAAAVIWPMSLLPVPLVVAVGIAFLAIVIALIARYARLGPDVHADWVAEHNENAVRLAADEAATASTGGH